MYYLGMDIGSVSINTAVIDEDLNVVFEGPYIRHFGFLEREAALLWEEIQKRFPEKGFGGVLFTGSNAESLAKEIGVGFEVETVCLVLGANKVVPGVRSIISIGGQDAMLLELEWRDGEFYLCNFSLNGPCASGTGSFIDQQAERLANAMYGEGFEYSSLDLDRVLKDFISLGMKSSSPAPVACRCTVFTKSDMIHLQNKGEPLENIIAGLHYGNAANFVSTIVGKSRLKDPIVFVGGMAANSLQVRALRSYYPSLIVPSHFTSIGAIGAAICARERHNGIGQLSRLREIAEKGKKGIVDYPKAPPLSLTLSTFTPSVLEPISVGESCKGFLGIDIGSTSTKYAFINEEGKVIFKCYVPTRGRPIEVVKYLLEDLLEKGGEGLEVLAVATTGSGRNVVGDFLEADLVVDEITAHARGALGVDPEVDTIFEIGGQDSKFISIQDGYPVDFDMNKVCAAGTGSFLQELANKFKINIVGEFQEVALSSSEPVNLTERCTVFMESDIMGYAQKGVEIPHLMAGLCYAIVHNYLNRVVGKRPIGKKIMFLGGPSLNMAVVAAFERVLNKEIITPPNREVMGAFGAALLVRELVEKGELSPRKRDLGSLCTQEVSFKETICRADSSCTNECKLKVYDFGGRKSIWGGDCGRYETTCFRGEPVEDIFKIRERIFLKFLKEWGVVPGEREEHPGRATIGIPLALHFWEWAPLWCAFWKEMGFSIYLTPRTSAEVVKEGIESVTTEMCFPLKVFHGHVRFLEERCDFYFLPNVINMASVHAGEKSMFCPMVAGSQFMVKQSLEMEEKRIISPHIYLKDGPLHLAADMHHYLKDRLSIPFSRVKRAAKVGFEVQQAFRRELKNRVRALLATEEVIWIVTGRPYNLYDPRMNLHLGSRLAKRGILAIPMDLLNTDTIPLDDFPRMYWGIGARILRCAKLIRQKKNLFGVHITNFSCGADSFIEHFYKYIMKDKPHLILEFDEHSAVAGMLTRIEAFSNVISSVRSIKRGG